MLQKACLAKNKKKSNFKVNYKFIWCSKTKCDEHFGFVLRILGCSSHFGVAPHVPDNPEMFQKGILCSGIKFFEL